MIRTQKIAELFDLSPYYFEAIALEFSRHQARHLPLYRSYIDAVHIKNGSIETLSDIPFLPISFFKSHEIITTGVEKLNQDTNPVLFESSGTTGTINSKHYVQDNLLYETAFMNAFRYFYGNIEDYCILGLLPSYLQRAHSSLVYMLAHLIAKSRHALSGFYLYQHEDLAAVLNKTEAMKQPVLLFGVSYALLDFAEKFPMGLYHTQILETGGMKGRRKEMIREEVHELLKKQFGLPAIHSEYGMTELLSQAYSKGEGIFQCPPWMKVLVRDVNDPFQIAETGRGGLNIIDLANIHSCCFIATDDLGEVFPDGRFTVLGRIDQTDLRGCSLMYTP